MAAAPIPDDSRLPTPVARLVHQAFLTRDVKKRHDYLLSAWEATFRLVVAADPPADPASLSGPSLGHWRSALKLPKTRSSRAEVLSLVSFLKSTLEKAPFHGKSVGAQEVVEHLPEYRNKCSTAHTAPRADEFYVRANQHLGHGLVTAWAEGLFLPADAEIVYVPDVEVDTAGGHQARLFELIGPDYRLGGESVRVPKGLLPGRVYLRQGTSWRSLYPWIVCSPQHVRARVLLFNSSERELEFLDCDSGAAISARQLQSEGVTVDDPTAPSPASRSASSMPPPSGQLVPGTRIPRVAPIAAAPLSAPASTLRSSAIHRPWLRRVAFAGAAVVLAAAGLAVFAKTRRLPVLRPDDWTFRDDGTGRGWLARCREHLATGRSDAATSTCLRAHEAAAASSEVRVDAARELGRTCSLPPAHLQTSGAIGPWMLIAPPGGLEAFHDPGRPTERKTRFVDRTCVVMINPDVTRGHAVFAHFVVDAPDEKGETRRDWFIPASHLAVADAARHAAACTHAVGGGVLDSGLRECTLGLLSPDPTVLREAARGMSALLSTKNEPRRAIAFELVAHRVQPDEKTTARIDELCGAIVSRRGPDDVRRTRAVSYPWADRTYRVRKGPKMTEPEVANLDFGTCVLVDGEKDGFLHVEASTAEGPRVGWMAADWAMPQ
jgi:hypothetical protein